MLVAEIGVMIGLFSMTEMASLFSRKGDRKEPLGVRLLAAFSFFVIVILVLAMFAEPVVFPVRAVR